MEIEKLKLKHNNFYDYSKVIYTKARDFISIICPVHGQFEQRYSAHLQGQSCLQCTKDKVRKTNKTFIVEANIVHNKKYSYPLGDKIFKSIKDYTNIICPLHGEFKQTIQAHLSGRGCSKCRYMFNNKRFEDWIKYRPNNPGIYYIIECFNENEHFYKIGITTKDSVSERYGENRKTMMPYNYNILIEEKNFDKKYIWEKEIAIKKLNIENHYSPNIKFNGSKTECFTKIKHK